MSPPYTDWPRRVLFGLATAWLLGAALVAPPTGQGDGPEYHLMSESFLAHATPDARPADVESLAARARRWRLYLNFGTLPPAYFEAANGRRYSYHFWGYSLVTVPVRALLRGIDANDLKGAQIVNALAFLLAVHQALFGAALPRRAALALGLLVLFSPAVWFVLWTHPEALCFALVLLALVWARAGRRHLPVLAVALAAMQNPPLLFLLLPLWVRACLAPAGFWPRPRLVLRASLAALPAVLPPVFFYLHFGTPSLIARQSASAALVSWRKALELFLDPNLGLLPYAPLVLALFIAALWSCRASAARLRAAWGSALILAVMALACSATTNWNHGTAGPSRYTIWMLPLVLMVVADGFAAALELGGRRTRAAWTVAVALAIGVQAAVVFGRGGLRQSSDWISHSYAARFVLRHAPRLYNPTPAIFVQRSRRDMTATPSEPAIYRDAGGCRKAWARPDDAAQVQAACAQPLPALAAGFFARPDRRDEFSYVDFD